MSNYQEQKEKARERAIQFQNSFTDGKSYSWDDLFKITAYFEKIAKRYGLTAEFKENGII